MLAVNGYYDGKVCVPLAKVAIQPQQKVIITVLDEVMPTKRNLKKYVGKISKEDSELIAKAVEDGRKVDSNAMTYNLTVVTADKHFSFIKGITTENR